MAIIDQYIRRYTADGEDDYYDKQDLGIVLKAIRECNGVSKTDLARMVGVNRKTVLLVENGERLPSLEYIYKFSKSFSLTIDYLLSFCS